MAVVVFNLSKFPPENSQLLGSFPALRTWRGATKYLFFFFSRP